MIKSAFFYFLCTISIAFIITSCGEDDPKTLVADYCKKDNCIGDVQFKTIATALRKDRRGRSEYGKDEAVWQFITEGGCKPCSGIGVTVADTAGEKPKTPVVKPEYSVFIENSYSMDGYVKGNSEFKNTVYDFLSDVLMKTNEITDKMSLNYINSKVIPFEDQLVDFIQKLDPNTFEKRGGQRGTTDLSVVMKRSIDSISGQRVVIFISDCVFSPGKNKVALDYLASQKTGFKRVFSDLIYAQPDLATIVIKLKSTFDGSYFDYNDKPIPLKKAQRPYYIWIVGESSHIDNLLTKVKIANMEGGIEDFYALYPQTAQTQFKNQIVKNEAIGRFDIDRDNLSTIINAETTDRGGNMAFRFAVAIDLKQTGMSESYLTDVNNYKLSTDKYALEVKPITDDEKIKNKALEKYSHKLMLSTKDLKPMSIDIELKRTVPKWIYDTNSQDDRVQTGEELNKTFGFKYMVEGVADAYQSVNKGQESFFKFGVTIKK